MILKDIYFFNGATSTGDSEILCNENKGSVLSIQIDCSGTFNIEVQGCIDIESGVYSQVFATNMLTSDREESITESGIYQVDIDGYRRIKLVLKSIGSSPITAYGAMKEKSGQADIEDDVATKDYVNAAVAGKEDISNKVTTISSSSTDTEYPSAKCVYDAIQQGGGGGGESKYFVYLDMPMQAGDLPFTCSADDQAKIEAICSDYSLDNTVLNKYLVINTKYGFNIDYLTPAQMKVFVVYSISSSEVVFRSNGYVSVDANTTNHYTDVYTKYIKVTYTRSTGAMTVSMPSMAEYSFKDRAYTAEKDSTVPQYSTMPTAGSSYSGQIAQYKGTTDANYTNGYFYICNNSGGSYAWHQINVQPASSGGQVYQHISTASSDDFGKNTTNAIDFTTLQKGTHIFKNVSTYNKLYYKYKKTSSSSYTSTSFTYGNSYTSGNQYSSYFIVEVFEDMSGGIYELNLDNGYTVALISVYINSDYSKLAYSMVVSNKTTGTLDYSTRSNLASSSQLHNVYTTANSASSAANQAAQQASTNAQAITALDGRVTALEQGGGGGGQTEYISDEGGTPYPPYATWSTSMGNYFTFAKETGIFKQGGPEYIFATLIPSSMYPEKINVNISYNYSTAMPDTSNFTIPNVTFKIYSTSDDSELTSISVGDVALTYDSMSNKWSFNKYDIDWESIMGGNNVYCKMFYGTGGSSSGGSVSITEIITQRQSSPSEYYLDPNKINNVCSGKAVRFHILPSELQTNNVAYLFIKDDNSSSYRISDFGPTTLGYLDIVCEEDSMYGYIRITGMMTLQNNTMSTNSYKMYIESGSGGMSYYGLWSQSWSSNP